MTKRAKPEAQTDVLLGGGGPTEAGWHAIEMFLRCPKAYQYGPIRGIRKPLTQTPDHFAVGTLFHAMRARWFALKFASDKKAWRAILDTVKEAKSENDLPVSTDAEQRALQLMQLYMAHWLKLPRPEPVAAEYKVGPAPLQPGDPFFLFRTARLDDVSRYPEAGGALAIGESKTTSTSINDTVRQYELHGQPLLQLALWRMCPNGEAKFGPVAGFVLDVSKKPYGNDKAAFGRVFVPVRPETIDWFIQSMRGYLRAAAAVDWDTEVPRNPQGCTFQAGRMRVDCDFKSLCRFGKSATIEYVQRGGQSLKAHKPLPGKEKMPWI
jgi:hypothetical protein